MKTRKFGNSDLMVSSIGLGCMGMSEWYGPTDDEESRDTIKAAFDMGLNFFDTADVYGNGHNETLLGEAVKVIRRNVVLATKFGFLPNEAGLNAHPDYVKKACDKKMQGKPGSIGMVKCAGRRCIPDSRDQANNLSGGKYRFAEDHADQRRTQQNQ